MDSETGDYKQKQSPQSRPRVNDFQKTKDSFLTDIGPNSEG